MEFHIVIPVLISFAISAVLGPVIIPFLRKLKMGQTERTEGVQSHLKKAGTPTMGGVIFLISTIITSSPGSTSASTIILSPDYSGAVSDSGIWYHRISG